MNFYYFDLDFDSEIKEKLFNILSGFPNFENICNGRTGGNLVEKKENFIPIVRTTTQYKNPVNFFEPIHFMIIDKIKDKFKIFNTNNAMIEIYDERYSSMKYHTDQSLDLDINSYICIFSIYEKNEPKSFRKLEIKNKKTNDKKSLEMKNFSIIIFSVKENLNHLHKIILENKSQKNKWLGITFRFSKTFIYFINEIPYFKNNNRELKIASEKQLVDFRNLKSLENKLSDYVYEDISIYYTLSISDTICPFELI